MSTQTRPGIRERSCGHKIRHETWTDAQRHLAQLPRKPGELMCVYRCWFCSSYHVGHYGRGSKR